MNPRPAGYESVGNSTQPINSNRGCDEPDSVVATLVATKTADKPCELMAIGDAPKSDLAIFPTDLSRVIEAWSSLPDAVRESILAIVDCGRDR